MGKTVADVLEMGKDVKMVDLRFTDLLGMWHHFSLPARELTEELFEEAVRGKRDLVWTAFCQYQRHWARQTTGHALVFFENDVALYKYEDEPAPSTPSLEFVAWTELDAFGVRSLLSIGGCDDEGPPPDLPDWWDDDIDLPQRLPRWSYEADAHAAEQLQLSVAG